MTPAVSVCLLTGGVCLSTALVHPIASNKPVGFELKPDGRPRHIVCYSGSFKTFEGDSDPARKIFIGLQDGHVTFVDVKTHGWTRVTGACVVTWEFRPEDEKGTPPGAYRGPADIMRLP